MKTITFIVDDMTCASCAMHLQELEDELEGIISVDASYIHQKMVVKYNEGILTEEQIIAAIKDKGYRSQVLHP